MMGSLRSRLLLGTGVGLFIVLTASGVTLYLFMRVVLYAQFDRGLEAAARMLASLVEQDEDGIEFDFVAGGSSGFGAMGQPEYFEIWTGGGGVLARSPSLNGRDLPRPSHSVESPLVGTLMLRDSHLGRSSTIRFAPRPSDDQDHQHGHQDEEPKSEDLGKRLAAGTMQMTITVAKETAGVDETLRVLVTGLIVVGATAIFVALLAQVWIVRRGLSPVSALAGQIAAIGEHDLAARVAAAAAPAELLPVVTRLNDLLTRLDEAFKRERMFSANVAHELRTPLAGLRTTLEVSLARTRDAATCESTMRECLTICRQTEGMVSNLLMLARLERDHVAVRHETIDLRGLLDECWQTFVPRAAERGVEVESSVPDGLVVQSDPGLLSVVLRNLFDNAVSYVDSGGSIHITCHELDRQVEFRICNTGSRLAADDAARIFDRFWRGDAARAATGVHCGLGLSLCKRIVTLLGGSIHVETTPQGEFQVVLRLR